MVNRDSIREFKISFSLGMPNSIMLDLLTLREWLHSWLFDFRVLTCEEQWKKIDEWNIPRFVQLTTPCCKLQEGARLTCAWIAWLHIFDDEFDDPLIARNPTAAEALIGPYLEYLAKARTGNTSYTVPGSSSGLLNAFIELNQWTLGPMSQAWQARWLSDMDDYVRAYVNETEHRKAGIILNTEELIQFKRVSMAQRPAMNLLERVVTNELSASASRFIGPVVDNVSDITGALNDPVSLAKERACGDSHNLVISLIHHQALSEREAIAYLVDFVNRRCCDLAQAIQEIPMNPMPENERQTLTQWMVCNGYWVRGFYEWLQETMRYGEIAACQTENVKNGTKLQQEKTSFEETGA